MRDLLWDENKEWDNQYDAQVLGMTNGCHFIELGLTGKMISLVLNLTSKC